MAQRRAFRDSIESVFQLLESGELAALTVDASLVEAVRTSLQRVPIADRYDALFVDSLSLERIDELNESDDNAVFPALSLPHVFYGKPALLAAFRSRKYQSIGQYQKIDGAYTRAGFQALARRMSLASGLVSSEAWVCDEGPMNWVALDGVMLRYEAEWIRQWTDFFHDIYVLRSNNIEERLQLLAIAGRNTELPGQFAFLNGGPMFHLVDLLVGHARQIEEEPADDPIQNAVMRRFNASLALYARSPRINQPIVRVTAERIRARFRSASSLLESPHGRPSPIGAYDTLVGSLRSSILEARIAAEKSQSAPPSLLDRSVDFVCAREHTRAALAGSDDVARDLMLPILLGPLELDP